jgi:hypothetical protein
MADQTWMVNMPFDAVQQMRQDVATAQKEVVDLKAQLAEAQIAAAGGGNSDMPRALIAGLRSALKIVQWSQGNYDPETVRGWPHEALAHLIEVIKTMPGADPNEIEWANDAENYVKMAAAVERARKVGRQKELNQIKRSSIGSDAYAGQVDSILASPPKEDDEAAAQQGAGEQPPEQTPPAAA